MCGRISGLHRPVGPGSGGETAHGNQRIDATNKSMRSSRRDESAAHFFAVADCDPFCLTARRRSSHRRPLPKEISLAPITDRATPSWLRAEI